MSTQKNAIKYRWIASVIKGVLVIHARPFAPRVGLHRFTIHTSTVARVVVFIPALLLARVSATQNEQHNPLLTHTAKCIRTVLSHSAVPYPSLPTPPQWCPP